MVSDSDKIKAAKHKIYTSYNTCVRKDNTFDFLETLDKSFMFRQPHKQSQTTVETKRSIPCFTKLVEMCQSGSLTRSYN